MFLLFFLSLYSVYLPPFFSSPHYQYPICQPHCLLKLQLEEIIEHFFPHSFFKKTKFFWINDKMASLSQSLFVPSMKRFFLPQRTTMSLLWARDLSFHRNRRALLRLFTFNCKWTEDAYVHESWPSFPPDLYFFFVGFVIFKLFPYLIGIDFFLKEKKVDCVSSVNGWSNVELHIGGRLVVEEASILSGWF